MVLLLLFDLPTQKAAQRRAYREFRKHLKRSGFIPIQESVYVLLLHNQTGLQRAVAQIEQAAPEEGSVALLPLSLRVFRSMSYLRGKPFHFSRFADDVIVI